MHPQQLIGIVVTCILIAGTAVFGVRRGARSLWVLLATLCLVLAVAGAAISTYTGFPPPKGRFDAVANVLMLLAALGIPAGLAGLVLSRFTKRGRLKHWLAQFVVMLVVFALSAPLGIAASIAIELVWYY